MSIQHVLAVVPVSDIAVSQKWYATLFGRPEDNHPMPSLVEWQVLSGAWVQVFNDEGRAGSGLLNFAVDDLDAEIAGLRRRGIEPGAVVEANKGVRLSALVDPDGNTVTLIGGFRVEY
ncbi:lactoylglutathione lyase family protein [Mycolicibacterium chubuense NBB4]|uniref:Lactoylglutathione lyase family protein n=1 Tax=Mycolicibacterium chubuense (strain NBB4) TaxID=710421 RepID=I4BD84_MYCCN|nr:VOC family protein [Mycolicibacterium chubuense]AFM15241.1 lactoylglutathione lyase family protein [Mycolicibacterium chubuense NBB4]